MKEEKKRFWEQWIEADEVERLKLIRSLPPFSRGGLCRMMTATLLNSYLTDLYKETRHRNAGLIDPDAGRMTTCE